jgi:hypothetical protein
MTAGGIIMRKGLRAQWEALLAQYGGDPWYHSDAGKKACKKLVEESADAGGANNRRDVGISLHTITALADIGMDPQNLTDETERDLLAYRTGLALSGVDIDRDYVEVTVVLDDWGVAGTFDRLAVVPGFDLPLVADLKTGADLSYSMQSIAVQLAAYAHADEIYAQGSAEDGSLDVRTPFPEVDQNWGLVLWLNAGTGTLELILVDLVQGWAAFEISMWTRDWRNAKVSIPLGDYTPPQDTEDLVPLLEASIAAVEAAKLPPADGRIHTHPGTGEPMTEVAVIDVDQPLDLTYTQRVRDWLQERVDAAGQNPAARAELGARWPQGMPSLKKSTEHAPEDLDEIELLLDDIEKRHSLGFPASKPTTDPVGQLLHLFPNSTIINNTGDTSA